MGDEVIIKDFGEKKGGCCAPRSERLSKSETVDEVGLGDDGRATVALGCGTFLMGTDYKYGFAMDGEAPVRRVGITAFEIDTYPVTNSDFDAFVKATGYRTEAERFGWSFVFWMHLRPERLDELGLCSLGGQGAADRGRVGVCGAGWVGTEVVSVGR
jgi:formylglycine-generating enzyme required for sulfatase activity